MSSSNESYFIRIKEPAQIIPKKICAPECFYINFHLIHSTSSQHYLFFFPRHILCDYDDFESLDPNSLTNIVLRNTFSSVPISPQMLEETLIFMGEYARNMDSNSYVMDVFFEITTPLNSSEKDELDDIETLSCAICLQEFRNGSKKDTFRTRCKHIFHQECVEQWFRHCRNTDRLHSCPMCRSQI